MIEISFIEQLAIAVTLIVIKPIYMAASLVIWSILRKSTDEDIVALRRAMLLFFFGEAFCAVNYLFYSESSVVLEYLHMLGMVGCFSFVTYASMVAVDTRFFHFSSSEKECAALSLCRVCAKTAPVRCNFHKIFSWSVAGMLMLCLIPLFVKPELNSFRTNIFGYDYVFEHPIIFQLFEIRIVPVIAMVLFTISLIFSLMKSDAAFEKARLFYAAATGFFGFGMMRLFLMKIYSGHMVWFTEVEEWTELQFIAGVVVVLWIFRKTLLPKKVKL